MLTQNQIDLCERDGLAAACFLLTRLNQHLFADAYDDETQRHTAAVRVLGAFCDVFAGALDEAMGEGRRTQPSVADVLEVIVRRHRRIALELAHKLDGGEAAR
ncbi:hypothetical protein [Burkholderia vietnamiensis]|uniref:hypothetical protein n=1 Tax=Burkholderia vietnamiensis TaxID=60552 RepID=UPI001594B056|nr:hypothetical protein [Burkholderia vietnamiensis]